MNTRQKGRKNELKAKAILEAEGWDVQLAPNPSKWSLQNDLFGLWDLIAVNSTRILCVQVKTNQPMYGKQLDRYQAWQCPPNVTKQMWVFHDRQKDPERFTIHNA